MLRHQKNYNLENGNVLRLLNKKEQHSLDPNCRLIKKNLQRTWNPCVVYFDQQTGSSHAICWLKSSFSLLKQVFQLNLKCDCSRRLHTRCNIDEDLNHSATMAGSKYIFTVANSTQVRIANFQYPIAIPELDETPTSAPSHLLRHPPLSKLDVSSTSTPTGTPTLAPSKVGGKRHSLSPFIFYTKLSLPRSLSKVEAKVANHSFVFKQISKLQVLCS